MSAKKRSFLCKIVHKLTENARFFAQKPHFLHIFAGGRDDFLAGRFWGFLGVRGGRARRGASGGILFQNPLEVKVPPSPFEADVRFSRIDSYRMLISGRTIQHSELAERTE